MKGNSQIMVNELGEQISNDKYICNACKKEKIKDEAVKKEWYYTIKDYDTQSKTDSSEMQTFPIDNVEYLCKEDYNKLSKEEAKNFAKLGYPFSSSFLNDNNILTY